MLLLSRRTFGMAFLTVMVISKYLSGGGTPAQSILSNFATAGTAPTSLQLTAANTIKPSFRRNF
jgi:hypothetical protein